MRAVLSLLLGVWSGLGSLSGMGPPAALADDALGRAGGLLWEMGEIEQTFSDQRITRRLTEAALDDLATRTATQLASRRDSLARLLPALDPNTALAQDLAAFVATWPDTPAFKASLLHADGDGPHTQRRLTLALGSLKSRAPDRRAHWKTPFPFLRP